MRITQKLTLSRDTARATCASCPGASGSCSCPASAAGACAHRRTAAASRGPRCSTAAAARSVEASDLGDADRCCYLNQCCGCH